MNAHSYLVPVHRSPLPQRSCGNVRFLQLLHALVTAHLNRHAADFGLDGIHI
jgi:hypothetical protein